jgi:tRNA-2-methylthio-N6-dimethylallyladenosine synthase
MNRKYSTAAYLNFVDYLRGRVPNIAITTDIIVGFPGETDADFESTLDILRRVEYDNIYAFIYSPRKGTPAASFEDQIPHEKKTARFARLLQVQDEISAKKNAAMVGKTVEALIEGASKTDAELLTARTDGNKLIHFRGDKSLIGQRIVLRITAASLHSLTGEI